MNRHGRYQMQSSSARGIGLLIGLAVLAIVVISRFLSGPTVSGPDVAIAPTFAGDPGEVERGAELYAANCLTCHGAGGRGDGPSAAALDPKPADFTAAMHRQHDDAALIASISNGVAGSAMPAFAELLSAVEIGEIVTYIRSLQAAFAAEEIPIPDPADCLVEPVSPLSFKPEGTYTPGPTPTPPPPVGPESFPWPQGEPATQTEIDGVTRTLREFSACANAGDYPRRLGLYTERALQPLFAALDEAGWQSTLEFVATPPADAPEGQREWVESITAVRRLPDGRVGAHVVTIDPVNHPHQSAAVVLFVLVGDRWLIDEVHQDLTAPAGSDETPVPGSGVPEAGLETPVTSGGLIVRMVDAPAGMEGGAVALEIVTANGAPLADATVEIAAEMPAMTMGIQVITAEPQGDGRYVAQIPLGMAGEWEFLALVTPAGGETVTFRFVATID